MTTRPGLRKAFTERFDEELRFFKGWVAKPREVGSIIPTSSVTARKMASICDPHSGLPVLELGPGTGVITKAILGRGIAPKDLHLVEYSEDFVQHLRRNYPGVNVIHGNAFDIDNTLPRAEVPLFDSVVSGVPLLNFPVQQRVRYVESLLDRLAPGRPIVQLTYGPKSPVPPGMGNYRVTHFNFIVRNIPPTQLWLYSRGEPVLPRPSGRG